MTSLASLRQRRRQRALDQVQCVTALRRKQCGELGPPASEMQLELSERAAFETLADQRGQGDRARAPARGEACVVDVLGVQLEPHFELISAGSVFRAPRQRALRGRPCAVGSTEMLFQKGRQRAHEGQLIAIGIRSQVLGRTQLLSAASGSRKLPPRPRLPNCDFLVFFGAPKIERQRQTRGDAGTQSQGPTG